MTPTERALLQLLADGQQYSGEALASQLGMTRAAVWKALKHIEENYHLTILATYGGGYRLDMPIELLAKERIVNAVKQQGGHVTQLMVADSLESTNTWLMKLIETGEIQSGSACLAEQQTAGRGRRGRTWVSPFGVNLYMSIFWCYHLPHSALTGLSLAVGVVVADTLRSLGIQELGLKWPNDILYANRKLGGILIELSGEAHGPLNVVMGLGLNMAMSQQGAEDITQPWISLHEIPHEARLSRNDLAARLLTALTQMLSEYAQSGAEPWLARWPEYDVFYEQEVSLVSANSVQHGIYKGIDQTGALLLETPTGLQHVISGEVSLRRREVT